MYLKLLCGSKSAGLGEHSFYIQLFGLVEAFSAKTIFDRKLGFQLMEFLIRWKSLENIWDIIWSPMELGEKRVICVVKKNQLSNFLTFRKKNNLKKCSFHFSGEKKSMSDYLKNPPSLLPFHHKNVREIFLTISNIFSLKTCYRF